MSLVGRGTRSSFLLLRLMKRLVVGLRGNLRRDSSLGPSLVGRRRSLSPVKGGTQGRVEWNMERDGAPWRGL